METETAECAYYDREERCPLCAAAVGVSLRIEYSAGKYYIPS